MTHSPHTAGDSISSADNSLYSHGNSISNHSPQWVTHSPQLTTHSPLTARNSLSSHSEQLTFLTQRATHSPQRAIHSPHSAGDSLSSIDDSLSSHTECLLRSLHDNQPKLNITKQDFLCVQIAALCHDMGHGPFSHLFDGMFIPEVRPGITWEHEKASVSMFHCMRKKNGLDKEMKHYGLNLDEDIEFIQELILKGQKDGQWSMKGRTEDKSFLYEIVANKLNGIDVDKWDYLARDCHYLGLPKAFDHQRLLKSARVCEVNKRKHICFRDKVAENIYGMFHTRYTLHRQALQHKIGYIIDVKIKDALVLADGKPDFKISDAIDNMLEYTKLTDHVFDQILHQSNSNTDLTEAKGILNDILKRRLPKFVGEARLKEEVLKEELCNYWQEKIMGHQTLRDKDFDIYVLGMGFGEGNEPIKDVYFYSKNEPNKAFKMEKYQVSSLKPKKFHEWLVRVYNSKHTDDQNIQQTVEEFFHEWCKNNKFIDSGNYAFICICRDVTTESPVGPLSSTPPRDPKKIFNDPIYGQIELDPLLMEIIDTPQFQRLRHIKQLGGTYLVYPGATHTRFEHSLGMAYLAGRMINVLKEKRDDLGIDEKDILCVQIAALCYNLGHGPFSHLYEQFYHESLKLTSILILEDILKDKGLKGKLQLNEKDLTFIKELVNGVFTSNKQWPAKGRTKDKAFLYEIVINKWNGIAVRRWDYFARDCYHLGTPNSFDHQRMLKSARVCKVNGRNHICFRDKVADSVYDMFKTQYTLYSQAYQHKIVNIIEKQFKEALTAAQDKLTKISPFTDSPSQGDVHQSTSNGSRKRKIASGEERVAKLSKLTDHIFEEILYSTDVELKDAREKLEDVVKRRLPKCVGETRITEEEFNNKQILQDKWNEAMIQWNKLHPTVFLDKKDFDIEVIQLDCTFSKGQNPFDSVYFYRKRNPAEAFKIKTYELSSLLPEEFTEYVGRVNYRKNSGEQKDAKECFKWWCLGKVLSSDPVTDWRRGSIAVLQSGAPSLLLLGLLYIQMLPLFTFKVGLSI
ncbi:unnamed protein product [Leuciscus chuanchicus]